MMLPPDPSAGVAPTRKKPRGPDPYPVSNSVQLQREACEALAKVQAGRPKKPPGDVGNWRPYLSELDDHGNRVTKVDRADRKYSAVTEERYRRGDYGPPYDSEGPLKPPTRTGRP